MISKQQKNEMAFQYKLVECGCSSDLLFGDLRHQRKRADYGKLIAERCCFRSVWRSSAGSYRRDS